MQVIKPITFQEAQLISTSATEVVSAYNAGTTYSVGNTVQYGTRLYISLVGSNLGNQPDISPTQWSDYSPDNRHAMFDLQVNTQTSASSPLVVVTQPGTVFNSIAYLNLVGTSINVTVLDDIAGTEVYNETISLDDTLIIDWYTYFFEPYELRTEVILTNIPPYGNGVITTTLTGGGTVKIGNMTYGSIYTIGTTQYGANVGIRDFSLKTTDEFGVTTFTERAFSKRLEATVLIDQPTLNFAYRLLSDIRAIPSVWIGSDIDQLRPLVVFGYYRDFNISINYPTYSLCSLSIEGLV